MDNEQKKEQIVTIEEENRSIYTEQINKWLWISNARIIQTSCNCKKWRAILSVEIDEPFYNEDTNEVVDE